MSADAARQALEDMLHKFVPSARLALEAADRLQAWLDDFQLSARLETPQYENPGELKEDLRLVLAALREQASPDAALIEALEQIARMGADPRTGHAYWSGATCAVVAQDALAAARAGETSPPLTAEDYRIAENDMPEKMTRAGETT